MPVLSQINTQPDGGDEGDGGLPKPPTTESGSTGTTHTEYPSGEAYPYDWQTKLRTDLVSQIEKWSDMFGLPKYALDSWVRENFDGAVGYIRAQLFKQRDVVFDTAEGVGMVKDQPDWNPSGPMDFDRIWQAGLDYYTKLSGFDFTQSIPSGGRGGGSRRPSADEIRNQFDEDQLTDAVQNMWGAYLLEDAPNARSIAKQYIEAVVAGRGEKQIDFETFVKGRIENTTRYKQVYQNKPEGMEALKYIGPYAAMVDQVVGGGAGKKTLRGSLAAGGAALGASQDAFSQRLMRTDAVRNSTGFITGLEQRVRGIKNVLRG